MNPWIQNVRFEEKKVRRSSPGWNSCRVEILESWNSAFDGLVVEGLGPPYGSTCELGRIAPPFPAEPTPEVHEGIPLQMKLQDTDLHAVSILQKSWHPNKMEITAC